jgi:hypothetical protein
MLARWEPRPDADAKLVGRHPGMGERQNLHQAVLVLRFQKFRKVARQGGLHHRVCGEFCLSKTATLQFIEQEGKLTDQR